MWTCPNCHKEFRNPGQAHSCIRTQPTDHFRNRPPELWLTYEELIGRMKDLGPYTLNPVKSCILVKNLSTFLAVKVKKDHLVLEFFLPEKTEDYRIQKTVQISRNRVVHYVALDKPEDLSPTVLGWIRTSYLLTGK